MEHTITITNIIYISVSIILLLSGVIIGVLKILFNKVEKRLEEKISMEDSEVRDLDAKVNSAIEKLTRELHKSVNDLEIDVDKANALSRDSANELKSNYNAKFLKMHEKLDSVRGDLLKAMNDNHSKNLESLMEIQTLLAGQMAYCKATQQTKS
ncbi:MAG: hypothetical protein BWY47_01405 [Bacteroidetes bacterium ADurb.Bin302]|nr:MAG: hypothetical protein BWY47_01405 [Bacteroidetes bacterium ADurb.Bin302]